jgi:hypothetical protein
MSFSRPPGRKLIHALGGAWIITFALLSSACGPGDGASKRAIHIQVLTVLEAPGTAAEQRGLDLAKLYNRIQDKQQVADTVVSWATRHPRRFASLASHLVMEGFAEQFAASAAAAGKTFLLVERLDGAGTAVQPVLQAMQRLDERDRRFKVPAYRLAPDSPLRRIARLSANHAGQGWEGGAMLLLESECQLGFAAAGHTFADESGALRAPLESFELAFAGQSYRVAEVVALQPSVAPEHDWALLVVNKEYCGRTTAPGAVALPALVEIPAAGLEVELYCYQQGPADVAAYLYQQQCRIYPSDAGVLDHYADKPKGLLGVHSCRSEKGSSGCPILLNEAGDYQFVGTQIERDSLTGAGIARLFSAEFRLALSELSARFLAHDRAYALQLELRAFP